MNDELIWHSEAVGGGLLPGCTCPRQACGAVVMTLDCPAPHRSHVAEHHWSDRCPGADRYARHDHAMTAAMAVLSLTRMDLARCLTLVDQAARDLETQPDPDPDYLAELHSTRAHLATALEETR